MEAAGVVSPKCQNAAARQRLEVSEQSQRCFIRIARVTRSSPERNAASERNGRAFSTVRQRDAAHSHAVMRATSMPESVVGP